MKKINYLLVAILALGLISCETTEKKSDAYGNFEATTVNVSSEMPGKILFFDIEEGDILKKAQVVAIIDTTLLHKQKEVLYASIKAIRAKRQHSGAEVDVLLEQKKHLLSEQIRLKKLLAGNAATQKQIDDLNAQIRILDKKIVAVKQKVRDANTGISSQSEPLKAQIEQINEQIKKSIITNPIDGQVLSVYKQPSEITASGMPLYKIADLSKMELKAYISGAQLPHIKLNQEVTVLIDEGKKSNKSMRGKVTWISSKAEFTPKTIQTKEERVNQVYAIKIEVENYGSIKIGMPGEVVFNNTNKEENNKN